MLNSINASENSNQQNNCSNKQVENKLRMAPYNIS